MEFSLGFIEELLRTSLIFVRQLLMPSRFPSLNSDTILLATQGVQRELNTGCYLRDLYPILLLLTAASRSIREKSAKLSGWEPGCSFEAGCCLAKVCGLKFHISGCSDSKAA